MLYKYHSYRMIKMHTQAMHIGRLYTCKHVYVAKGKNIIYTA